MATNRAGPGETRAEIKRLIDAGLSVREIALRLGISTQAVYRHLQTIREQEGAA